MVGLQARGTSQAGPMACDGLTYQVGALQWPYRVVIGQDHAQIYVCCSARALQQHQFAQEAGFHSSDP